MAVPVSPDLLASFRAGLRQLGPLTRPRGERHGTAFDDALGASLALAAEMDAGYQRKLRRWERDRPKREAAERAMQRANAQRAAELGRQPAGRVPVLAALWAGEPTPPKVW